VIAVRDLPVVTSIAPAVVVRVGDRPEPDLVLTFFALGATRLTVVGLNAMSRFACS